MYIFKQCYYIIQLFPKDSYSLNKKNKYCIFYLRFLSCFNIEIDTFCFLFNHISCGDKFYCVNTPELVMLHFTAPTPNLYRCMYLHWNLGRPQYYDCLETNSDKISGLVLLNLSADFDIVDQRILTNTLEIWVGLSATMLKGLKSYPLIPLRHISVWVDRTWCEVFPEAQSSSI